MFCAFSWPYLVKWHIWNNIGMIISCLTVLLKISHFPFIGNNSVVFVKKVTSMQYGLFFQFYLLDSSKVYPFTHSCVGYKWILGRLKIGQRFGYEYWRSFKTVYESSELVTMMVLQLRRLVFRCLDPTSDVKIVWVPVLAFTGSKVAVVRQPP